MNPVELHSVLTKFVPEMNNILDSRIHKALLCDNDDAVYRALVECKQAYQKLIEKLQIVAHQIQHDENNTK
jgi:hypothetical protein